MNVHVSGLVWRSASLFLIVLAPSQIWLGQAIWRTTSGQLAIVLSVACAYLLVGLFYPQRAGNGGLRGAVLLIAAGLAPLSAAYLTLLLISFLTSPYSRGLLLVSSAMYGLFLLVQLWIDRFPPVLRRTVDGGAVVAVLVLCAIGVAGAPAEGLPAAVERIRTNRHVLRAAYYPDIASSIPGGGIGLYDDDLLLVTGEGEFFRVILSEDTLKLESLALRAPLNREEFLADVGNSLGDEGNSFRVSGLFTRPTEEGILVVVSHHYWKADEACFVLRFSQMSVPRVNSVPGVDYAGEGSGGWRTLYETKPCLSIKEQGYPIGGNQSGGRIVSMGDSALIVTVGDLEFDGVNHPWALPQLPDNDYGKTLLLPLAGGSATVFTLGHRNPQGLLITASGDIWSTEHGARGGDELNLLTAGADYGWPAHTYGTGYSSLDWTPAEGLEYPPGSVSAEYAWVPSIGVSNLIEIDTDEFPRWKGDILVASMWGRTLYRMHREDQRFVYAEPIAINGMVRDLIEAQDGRLVMWTTEGALIVLGGEE